MDFILELDRIPGKSLYKCLADQLNQYINEGRLAIGQPLPPSRELARTLGVSRYTVVRAYNELVSRGQAEVLSTHGIFVTGKARRSQTAGAARKHATPPLVGQLSDYSKRLAQSDRLHATSGYLPQLNFGASPSRLLPVRRWQHALLKHCSTSTKLVYQPDVFGRIELRQAIAAYLSRTKGIICSFDQVIIFSQTQNALNVLCRLLLNEGDRIAVEEPGFGGIKNTVFPQHADICPIEIDEDGLKISGGLDRAKPIQLIYVTPAHHDPTGTTLSKKRRMELLEHACSDGTWIIEDDFDSDFYYGDKPLPPLAALDRHGAVIYMSSFWKSLYPLTAVRYIVVPPSLIPLMTSAKAIAEPNAEALEHLALADFLQDGFLERHLRKLRKIYAKQRSALLFNLKQAFKESIRIARQSAGTHQLICLNVQLDDRTIRERAAASGLGLESTANYYSGTPQEGEFLVDFTAVTVESCADVVKKFRKALTSKRT